MRMRTRTRHDNVAAGTCHRRYPVEGLALELRVPRQLHLNQRDPVRTHAHVHCQHNLELGEV